MTRDRWRCNAGGIAVLDVASGRFESQAFRGLRGQNFYIGYNDDGSALSAQGTDGSAWWFDVATRQPIGSPIPSLPGPVGADLRMRHLVTKTDKGLRFWNFDMATWPAIACTRAGRNLTRDEWARYLPTGEPYHATCAQYPAGGMT